MLLKPLDSGLNLFFIWILFRNWILQVYDKKWRETFQEAAMDLFQRLRSQRGGGGGSGAEGGGELTLENLLIHFRIDPDLVGLNREEDSFD